MLVDARLLQCVEALACQGGVKGLVPGLNAPNSYERCNYKCPGVLKMALTMCVPALTVKLCILFLFMCALMSRKVFAMGGMASRKTIPNESIDEQKNLCNGWYGEQKNHTKGSLVRRKAIAI